MQDMDDDQLALHHHHHHHNNNSAPSYFASAGYHTNIHPNFTHSCILELRKEKSRDAARSRRTKENQEFFELAKMLPLPGAIASQLDKASVIRLTMSYLKLRDFCGHGDPPWDRDTVPLLFNKPQKGRNQASWTSQAVNLFEQHHGTHILQSLDGFAFALTPDGRFLYISETVSIYLGLSQVEVTGSSLFDYVHREDHNETAEQLGIHSSASNTSSSGQNIESPTGSVLSDDEIATTPPSSRLSSVSNIDVEHDKPATPLSILNDIEKGNTSRAFCIRMKSTLTKRGCHFKSAGYRVVLLLSRMRPQVTFSQSNHKSSHSLLGMVVLAIALPPPSVNEVRLETDMFVTRLNFDFRIAHCEPRVEELIDYSAEELTGRSMYSLCHGQDIQKIRKCHVDLMSKGQVMSQYYRMMNRNAGYTWVQTCATVIMNSKSSDEQSIICINYILSRSELNSVVMDRSQLDDGHSDLKPDDSSKESSKDHNNSSNANETAEFKDDSHDGEPPCTPDDRSSENQMKNESVNDSQPLQMPCTFKDMNQDDSSDVVVDELGPEKQTVELQRKRKYSDSMLSSNDSVIKVPSCNGNEGRDTSRSAQSPQTTLGGTKPNDERITGQSEPSGKQHMTPPASPIQWLCGTAPPTGRSSPLSASALLRHIYANRESVIRSNFHHATTRGPYYTEAPTSVAPNSDSFLLDQSQFLLQSKLSNAPSSPRDKFQFSDSATEVPPGYLPDESVKAQMYHHHHHASVTLADSFPYHQQQLHHDQTTTPSHHQAPPPFYNSHHHSPGFHLYHSGLNKVPLHAAAAAAAASSITYIDGLKNTSSWYSTS